MKTIYRTLFLILTLVALFSSCEDQDDVSYSVDLKINDFIWKGLNQYYLWQQDVPNLADTRFSSQNSLDGFLINYSDPTALFEDLLYKPSSKFKNGDAVDRFSWIVEDYTVLEQELQGTYKSNGMDFRLSYIRQGSDELIGYVRYVLPNSDASAKGIKRGDVFTGINGTKLTLSNYNDLINNSDSYTLNMASIVNNTIINTGESIVLEKSILDENPIYLTKVITVGSQKIGYIVYNGFFSSYDLQLNQAFAELKTAGVTDLVLDLRYNSGGSVQTATYLASMITGSHNGKVFSKQKWNDKINSYFESEGMELQNNRFTDKIQNVAINSLNLNKVYILTSSDTASASELVINGLKPYINVVQIGATTVGKNVGSITIYDSETFGKKNVNPLHKYAMQPLVLKIVNAQDFGDYTSGIVPDFEVIEKISTMGQLGDTTEPLLQKAISIITGSTSKKVLPPGSFPVNNLKLTPKEWNSNRYQMYVDKVPEGLLRALK